MGVYVLGIDIGTQGVKGALFTEQGECVSQAGIPSQLIRSETGAVTEDPEFQYRSVLNIISSCLEQAQLKSSDEIAALSIDGQMAGILGVGTDGSAVTPYDSWLDTRCSPYLDIMEKRAGSLILERAGAAPSLNHGPKKLWWKHERPDTYKNIRAFVTPGGYAAARMCDLSGEEAFIDKTHLHFSGFSDTRAGIWDEELCRMFDIDINKQGRIVNSIDIIGHVSKEAASMCGLKAGTPVAAGCGDTVASFLSSGGAERNLCIDVAGTASVFAITTDDFTPDVSSGTLGCCASVEPGLWYLYAYINGGGMNPEWFTKITNQDSGEHRFETLEKEAFKIKDSLSLPLFIPHMAGRVMPGRPDLRGSFAGLTWDHTNSDIYRSILEAVALEYGVYKKAALKLRPDLEIKQVRITGGGQASNLWNTIKSGVLQAPVLRIRKNQGAPLGSAMVAAVAVGLSDSFSELSSRWIETDTPITCDPKRHSYFSERLHRYEELLQVMEQYHRQFPFTD
jgi:xylulokinase